MGSLEEGQEVEFEVTDGSEARGAVKKGGSVDSEAKQIILDFYKEIGGNQDELHFTSDWFSGASYKVTRKGHGYIDMRRIYIDDYLDSKNESAEKFIKGKLEKLLKMEVSA